MLVNFENVVITVEADTPEAAYDQLCDLFAEPAAVGMEYTTDTYSTQPDGATIPSDERSTHELWPDNRRLACEFVQDNPHEWWCTVHDQLCIGSTQEPNSCPDGKDR